MSEEKLDIYSEVEEFADGESELDDYLYVASGEEELLTEPETEEAAEDESELEDSYVEETEVEEEEFAEITVEAAKAAAVIDSKEGEETFVKDFKLEQFLKLLSKEESKQKALAKSLELGNSNWIGHSRYKKFYESLF